MNKNSDLPADIALEIVPDTEFLKCRAIYVGAAGDVQAVVNGVSVLFAGAASGTFLPIRATNVIGATTTATNLVALY